MGTWGTAISSNDTYADIYDDFFALYNDGFEVAEISKRLIDENQEILNDPDDSNNFWFALAKAQWECKQLDIQLYDRVKKIIETGTDLEVWNRLDADEKDIKKRKVILDKFLSDISTERPKAKSRKKKIIRQPLFEKGDCLTFQFENGNYGGAVVLEAIKDTEYGLNLIALTRINQEQKPSTRDFENSNVLVKSFGAWADSPDIGWYNAKFFNRGNIKIEIAVKVDVEIDYDPTDSSTKFYYGGSDIHLIQIPTLQFEFEKTNDRPSKRLTVKEFIKKK